jgi:hypothetical protein
MPCEKQHVTNLDIMHRSCYKNTSRACYSNKQIEGFLSKIVINIYSLRTKSMESSGNEHMEMDEEGSLPFCEGAFNSALKTIFSKLLPTRQHARYGRRLARKWWSRLKILMKRDKRWVKISKQSKPCLFSNELIIKLKFSSLGGRK